MAGPEQRQCWSDSLILWPELRGTEPFLGPVPLSGQARWWSLLIEIAASPRKQEGLPEKARPGSGRSVLEVG